MYSSYFDAINNHLVDRDEHLTATLVQYDLLIREWELANAVKLRIGASIEIEDRIRTIEQNLLTTDRRLPNVDILIERNLSCNYRKLYEVITMNIKNSLMSIQNRRKNEDRTAREFLIERIVYMENTFGVDSYQAFEQSESLLRYDDVKLKERATKFRDFLDCNNERTTTAFCRLSKEGRFSDDLSQIRNEQGEDFDNTTDRGEHIRKFYENLYKKKLDNLLAIEDFLGGDLANEEWIRSRKLTVDEKNSLEGVVSIEELKESLDASNFDSTSGWDGISFRVIRKL
jgi:hypothetical protein